MTLCRARLLAFVADPETRAPSIGRVHADGSITFRGKTYPTIKALPSGCLALRPDASTQAQWLKMYRAVDPKRKHPTVSAR